jgi:transcriptional regulator with XRE-family HTH domain
MANTVIKANIERLLKEKNWRIADLEKRMGPGKQAQNIIRGTSKNPTIEVLQSIARAFEVGIQDLVNPQDSIISKIKNDAADLGQKALNTQLLLEACTMVIKEIESTPESVKVTFDKVCLLIKEVYDYSLQLNIKNIDQNFVKWLVQRNIR